MNQRHPVWPYFALALASGVIGTTLLFYNLRSDVPAKEALQKMSGTVGKVFLIDDLSGERTGFMKPMNSIHFTLEKVEGEFRYPSSWPGYTKIWEQLSFHVDVWVRRSDIGTGEPMVVFRLEQQGPENWRMAPLSISYERITESQSRSRRSYVQVGATLLVGSTGFILIATLVRIRNRREHDDSPIPD